ncbi:MAG: cation-transporting P-type ATPase [Nanoarchaeota archaeon]|nr:cation-transporting P-type ATPase [Nanoarchaeota archaeon]
MKKFEGLSKEEAENYLKKYGYNEIRDISEISPLQIFLRQIRGNFVIYLLLVAMIISFFVGKDITAYTIFAVIFMVIFVGFIQEYKAEKAINALKEMVMPVSIVIRDRKEIEISSKEIVPGDILILRTGEKIPADCIILEQNDLLLNESILTGESGEVKKEAVKNLKEYKDENTLFMGSFIINGKCIAKVTQTGMNTKFGKIAGLISMVEKEMPLQKKINRISKYMAFIGLTMAILTGFIIFINYGFSKVYLVEVLILTIAIAVSAFPEGFPVVLISTLSAGAYRMAKKNAIVNRMSIIETLGETTVICSDKTGTLTKGEMTVKKIFCDNKIFDVSGTGYEGDGDFFRDGKKIELKKEEVLTTLFKTSVLCNDSKIERSGEDRIYNMHGTPTEAALLVMAAKAKLFEDDFNIDRIEEISFSSERKMMSVLYKEKKELFVYAKGAPELLIKNCKLIKRYNGIFTLTEKEKKKIFDLNKRLTSESLRTIGLAYKKVKSIHKNHFEEDLIFLGIVAMEDPAREEVKEAIKLCKKAGINVKMVTGDYKETAIAIAKKIGIFGEVIEGYELDQISEEELSKIVNKIAIFARVKPEHKLKIVKALKMNGEIVTMTGDGVNDAHALKEAHIGVAMGKGGTDVSRSVADLILKDDNFSTIVEAIKEGRTICNNIKKFVSYQLSCNYAELMILFIGVLVSPILGWPVPVLLALHILFMNLVTDNLPAITLGLNPSSQDIMQKLPRKNRHILTKNLFFLLIFAGTLMGIFALGVFYFTFNVLGQTIADARTTTLVALIMFEIAGAFNFRSFRKGVLNRSPFINKYLVYASIISVIATILIIYTPLNKIFETVNISIIDWIVALGFSLLLIIIFDILKRINSQRKFFSED